MTGSRRRSIASSSPRHVRSRHWRRCYREEVKALKAHVQNGQIVLDEPSDLPEGAAVEVLLIDAHELPDVERVELATAVAEGADDVARGEVEDARAFARRLAAKT